MSSSQPSQDPAKRQQKLSDSGKPLPDIGLKWGRSPKPKQVEDDENNDKPDFSTYYTPEEQEKLRAKGINPTLKAEMEWHKNKSEGKGFWGKVAGTSFGGGWIK